ncbi:MAG: DUF1080 domain-containing protein, partial [Pirellulales bacterium]
MKKSASHRPVHSRLPLLPACCTLLLVLWPWAVVVAGGNDDPDRPWRSLPLFNDGKVDHNWIHVGWGGFVVDGDSLRTECDEKGMGLLLYKKEQFGDCQIRVVYKSRDAKSNAGVFVRIDSGILERVKDKPAAVRRNQQGGLSSESLKALMESSQEERGPWYAVHHGYEVQICDESDEFNRTGAIYSLAKAARVSNERPNERSNEWRTMVITLDGNLVRVDIDGQPVTTFDPDGNDVPSDRSWYEPKREPKRPTSGYLGLQNH